MTQVNLENEKPPHYDSLHDNNNHNNMKDNNNNNNNNNNQPPPPPQPPTAVALPSVRPTPAWQHTLERVVSAFATPINNIATRKGTHSFVPQAPNLEIQKATSILSQFTSPPPGHNSHHEPIPPSDLSTATALLILTTLRVGFRHITLSSGSGVLLVRRPESNPAVTPNLNPDTISPAPPTIPIPTPTPGRATRPWSPPVTVKTLSVGAGPFALGLDVSDRVYVVQTPEALDTLLKGHCVGSVEGVAALGKKNVGGGVGFPFWFKKKGRGADGRCGECGRTEIRGDVQGGEVREEGEQKHHLGHGLRRSLSQPIQCYVRSAGLFAGVQAEGMMVTEREEENIAFYGRDVSVARGVMPTAEEEWGMSEVCKEALGALRAVLETAETGRVKTA